MTESVFPQFYFIMKIIIIFWEDSEWGQTDGEDWAQHSWSSHVFVSSGTSVRFSVQLFILLLKEDSKDFQTTLPSLAQDILAIPATSVTSERVFPISGISSENRKSKISTSNLQSQSLPLIFLWNIFERYIGFHLIFISKNFQRICIKIKQWL